MGLKILVTGSEGYVGSRLVQELVEHEVVLFDAKNGEDITDFSHVSIAAQGCDWIVHLAGIVGIANCERDPARALAVNVDGTRNILRCGKKVIFSSVLAKYATDWVDERTPPCPSATYYKTKLQAEALVQEAGHVVLRFGALYGVNPAAMRDDLLIHAFCKEAVEMGRITLFQPDSMRPVTNLNDAVAAIKFFLNDKPTFVESAPKVDVHWLPKGIFNVVTVNVTKRKIAANVSMVTRCRVQDIEGQDDEGRNYMVDTSKLRSLGFGFGTPDITPPIRIICDWYKQKR
jgi:nucleoside-diphosphate-sugar epimerase